MFVHISMNDSLSTATWSHFKSDQTTGSRDSLVPPSSPCGGSLTSSSTLSFGSTNEKRRSRYQSGSSQSVVPPATILSLLQKSSGTVSEQSDNDGQLLSTIELASGTERMFALRAAETSKLLKAWCDEVESWSWPGGFEAPMREEELESIEGDPTGTLQTVRAEETECVGVDGYWGSLRKEDVLQYRDRIEMLQHQLNDLDVTSQKNHVLQAHLRHKSAVLQGKASTEFDGMVAPYMDGLTALVTITIMQALPYFSRLSFLLELWSVRVSILEQVPEFLNEIRDAQKAFDDAWLAIGVRQNRSTGLRRERTIKVGKQGMFRGNYERLHERVGGEVRRLCQRVDDMLDILEGSEETLPNTWIDLLEGYEVDYGCWTMEAQKKVMQYELRLDTAADGGLTGSTTLKTPADDRPPSRMPGAWRDSLDDDEEDMRPSTAPGRVSISHDGPARHVSVMPGVPQQYRHSTIGAERPTSSHADIVREHIMRVAAQPGINPSSRPQTPIDSHVTKAIVSEKTTHLDPSRVYSSTASTPALAPAHQKRAEPTAESQKPTQEQTLAWPDILPGLSGTEVQRRDSTKQGYVRRISSQPALKAAKPERPKTMAALRSPSYGSNAAHQPRDSTPLRWSHYPLPLDALGDATAEAPDVPSTSPSRRWRTLSKIKFWKKKRSDGS
ncbi:MAG: hypothetical protein Q9162_006475 [Coniocarpon cinnabarinum]